MPRRLFALALLLAAAGFARPEEDELALFEKISLAIDRGVEWLDKRQSFTGSWGVIGGDVNYDGGSDVYRYPQGPTALALLTLLKCGMPPDHKTIDRGFSYIETHGRIPESTYEVATLMLAIEARTNQTKREARREAILRLRAKPGADVSVKVELPKDDREWMQELADALVEKRRAHAWRYGLSRMVAGGEFDMSNTQMATLALYVAVRAGVKVRNHVFTQTIEKVLAEQEQEGPEHIRWEPWRSDETSYAPTIDHARGWAYDRKGSLEHEPKTSGSMTTGGIVSLLAAQKALALRSPSTAKRYEPKIEIAVNDGLAWLDKHWRIDTNPPRGGVYHLMYLYGLERVGDMLPRNRIGSHDWYLEGAQWLVRNQRKDGHWLRRDTHEPQDVLNTCFALLFLEKATLSVPVASGR